MEPVERAQECSLKVDAIWSEAEENLLIKEEIISDLEPDNVTSGQENCNDCIDHLTDAPIEDDCSCNGYPETSLLSTWQPSKKKLKSRSQRNEEPDMIINHKLSCLHDTKNFKIVKRRLRCGDCKSLVCPECCKVMIPNLQSHFLGSGVGGSGTYLCKLCNIIFQSLCALQAHIRIHTMDTPYVCPDCGLIYNNIYFLILHLLNKCYHVYKIVRYKCKQCPGAYFTPENFVHHIQEKHIHCVFRCLYCSSLFNNYNEFNNHMEKLHQKQKVQYLNYFRCSLCSNMVIPKFMYQRHVAQHRENSEFYEIDYQCLCGETYSLIGAFRSHFSYCSKKGVLPPKWSFLQKKLRTHDVIAHENFSSKEIVIQSLPIYSKNDADYQRITVLRNSDKNIDVIEEKITNKDDLENVNCAERERNESLEINEKEIGRKPNEIEESNICNSSNNFNPLDNSSSLNQSKDSNVNQAEKIVQSNLEQSEARGATNDQSEETRLNDAPSDSVPADDGKKTEETKNTKNSKDPEQNGGEIPKIYDHIPCDHLGYVIKKQCPELVKKTCQEGDDIEKSFSPKSYKIVTELDEKTGMITTKTVPFDELEILEEEEDENINDYDCDSDSINFYLGTKQYSNEKSKFKLGNSLSCPFCIVLFPKHNLTFQQFRLHLESYHPDAALNIVVDQEEKIPEPTFAEELSKAETANKVNGCEEPKSNSENAAIESPSNQVLNSDSFQNEASPDPLALKDANESVKENGRTEEESTNDKINTEQEKENSPKDTSKPDESSNEGCSQQQESLNEAKNASNHSWELEDCRVETVSTHLDSHLSDENLVLDKNGKEENKSKEEFSTNQNSVEGNMDEGEEKSQEADKMEETTGNLSQLDSVDKIFSKSLSDLDYEGETSKDSNWSGISAKDPKLFSDEFKSEDKERSRRESEVWSEFYESLMLAEKLKKRKNPSPESESKKKSVVSDYSSKRIVKKPKRYRESSDESLDSNEISESDDEFLLENDFIDKIYSEEKTDPEEQISKKQVLLDKLESVDGRFVDYLFDLVSKKQKLFEPFKKHSSLRANRYSHDLRSYRRKVLNGIKQRGRPLKILRYHELLKKKEMFGDKNGKDSYQSRRKSELSPESKAIEKKRGRPRKYHDAAKLKERRRSDKEVDFIEKNFEREENDFSPSKRKRKLSSKLQYYRKMSDEKDDFSSGQVITNKSIDSSKKFTCAVCKELFLEMAQFREHIIMHRMEENTYQCMECGECFVVRPSLEKHLHAFHKIKNTDKYIMDNQCCNIKKEVIEADNEPLKENQCKVCKDQFDRPIDLTKHFRIHGMAFLKEFKKDGKSSEKRNA